MAVALRLLTLSCLFAAVTDRTATFPDISPSWLLSSVVTHMAREKKHLLNLLRSTAI